jgi:TldD protein
MFYEFKCTCEVCEVLNEDLAANAVDYACKLGASYVDVRLEAHYYENICVINGKVERAFSCRKAGIGIRALADGAWGFQSTTDLSGDGVIKAAGAAVRMAKALAKHMTVPVKLAAVESRRDSYNVKVKLDIEDIPFEDKIGDIQKWERRFHISRDIARAVLDYTGIKIDKFFINSEGAGIKFESSVLWADLKAEAAKGGFKQYFSKYVGGSGGYELIKEVDVSRVAEEIAIKAQSLLKAKPAREEKEATVIMDPSYVALLVHEICGHPSEADRVLGREAAWAGASWWSGQLGKKIGSDLMTVYDDPTVPGTLGFYLYDDEGVKARRKVLVERGIVKEHIHSRETAAIFGAEPNSGMRAVSYEYVPLIRMSNTFFEAGDWTVEEMIEDVKHGYLISAMRYPSIDDKRYNWTISAHEAYEIKNGELTAHIRDVALTSTAPKFFQSIDAASKIREILPLPGCGKGDPMQALPVGNGGPYIRGTADILGAR